jgi:NhaP-type Na+/H+ or K+/H+ antiporter
VAVLAQMKNAGASAKLTIVIVGESLMNDGTAAVLFTLFFNIFLGDKYSAGDIIGFFFAEALGSALFGIAFGLFIVRWLRSANNSLHEVDVTIQIAITICCAYLIFFLAQYELEISGLLACYSAGLMLAWLAPPIILSRETMHNVWGMIEWIGNTLIFLLAGLIIGHRTLNHVYPIDWLYMFLLYVFLMIIRAMVIAMMFPWLNCTVKEAVFMSWAGLRGALSMALALIVENTRGSSLDEAESSRFFFYIGGMAALTLLINATFARTVLDYLQLEDDNAVEKELVVSQIKKRLKKKMERVLTEMAKDLNMGAEDLEQVRLSCSLLTSFGMDDLYRDTEGGGGVASTAATSLAAAFGGLQLPGSPTRLASEASASYRSRSKSNATQDSGSVEPEGRRRLKSAAERRQSRVVHASRLLSMAHRGLGAVIIPDLLAYVRAIFLEIVRVRYWHLIEAGKLPRLSHSAQFLLYSIDVALDSVRRDSFEDFKMIRRFRETQPWSVYFLSLLDSALPHWECLGFLSRTLGRLESRHEKRVVYMLTSFIEAHEHAQSKIHAFIGVDDEDDSTAQMATPEELRVKADSVACVSHCTLSRATSSPLFQKKNYFVILLFTTLTFIWIY